MVFFSLLWESCYSSRNISHRIRFCSLASSGVLFEKLAVVDVSFRTVQLGGNGATRPIRLVTSSLYIFNLTIFRSLFLGAQRGTVVTAPPLS